MLDTNALPDISTLAAPLYVLFIIIEMLLIRKEKAEGRYETRDATTSLVMGLGNVISNIIVVILLGSVIATIHYTVYDYRLFEIASTPLSIFICFILDDCRYYWSHRLSHTIRWCWAAHVIHHSSQHYNLSTALRQPWFSVVNGLLILQLPLIFLGFDPLVVLFVASLNLFYQFFIHTETIDKLPKWVEALFNTPSHHRVHHGRNLRYLDANYAGVLIIWDKLFGTFVPEQSDEKVQYGLVHNIGTFNPIRVATHEYVSIFKDVLKANISWKDRFHYLFSPPGWSHDGSRIPTKTQKKIYLEENPHKVGEPGFSKAFLQP